MNITLRPSQLRALLAKTIPAHEPILITGKPGIGKTDIVTQAAADAGADCVVMHPVVSDPTDFKGMPWVEKGDANFLPFGDLKVLISAKKLTVCFFDDLGQAAPSVQAAVMQLVQARRVNGHKVSKHVVFIAATNRRADRAGVTGILEPLKSRFATIVELDVHVDDWCQWAVQNNLRPEVIAFIRFRPALLCDFQPTADMTNSPTCRTWAAVARGVDLDLARDLQMPYFSGAVGQGAGGEFVSFLRVWQDMVSPDVILTTPDTAPIPTEPSALYAVGLAIANRVKDSSMGRYCKYLERLIDASAPDVAAVSMKAALAREPKLANTAGYIQAMSGALGAILVGND